MASSVRGVDASSTAVVEGEGWASATIGVCLDPIGGAEVELAGTSTDVGFLLSPRTISAPDVATEEAAGLDILLRFGLIRYK